MTNSTQKEILTSPKKSLAEQRLDLQHQLQLNRNVLFLTFTDNRGDNQFPRSMVMRFLTQQTTLQILKKLACTTMGIKAVQSMQYGFSLWQLVRGKFRQ